MIVVVTCTRHVRRFDCVACSLILLFLAACASATPELSPTATVPPAASFTATMPPTVAPTTTNEPTATDRPIPQPSAAAVASATSTSAPSATVAASATAALPTPRPTAADFTPQLVSVWTTSLVGADNMQGTCSNPVTPVYGLVQITPQGNTLIWKNQEPAPYTMSRVRVGVWQYSGPTSLNDGTVTLVVQFTSPTTLQLTRSFVASAEPNCTHVHHYTGVFQWNR